MIYTGGTQLKTNKFITRDGELVLLRNASTEIIGSLKTRKGFTQTGSTLQSGKSILGLFGLEQANGTDKHLAVVNNSGDTQSVLKYNNSGTWTNITGATTLPANAQVNFVSFLDQAYIFGANSSNSYLTTGTLTGTTHGTESGFPKARHGIVFYDKLYLGDCEVSGVRYPSRSYYSSIPTYSGGWSISFTTATNYLQVETDDGDKLMGYAKSFGRLLHFKQYSLHSWDLANLSPVDGIGTTSSRSIANIRNFVFYFHYSDLDKGIFMWNGSRSEKISRPVDPFIKGMDSANASLVAGGVKDSHVYMYIGDVTLDTDIAAYYGIPASWTNVLLEYSFEDNLWIINTLPVTVKVMAAYNNELYFGDENGKVYQWGLGTTDDGTAIELEIITHNDYGTPKDRNKRKSFELISNFHKSNTAQAFYSIDNEEWQPLGGVVKKVTSFGTLAGKGYGIRQKYTSNSAECIFEGDEVSYLVEGDALK